MVDQSDRELLDDLGVTVETKKKSSRSPEEARVIAGFEEIVKFMDDHGHRPVHGEDRDIFERLCAVRLDRLRGLTKFHVLLAPLDRHGLLHGADAEVVADEGDDDEALLADLGIEPDDDDISTLKHVKPRAEIRAAEEIATRTPCKEFARYKPLFAQLQGDLDSGARETRRFGKNGEIKAGEFFILGGQTAYVASLGDVLSEYDRTNRRVHLIFENGTESEMLLRSFQRALYKDEAGRRVTDPTAGPLFGNVADAADTESGTIYVLRSKSNHPEIAKHREIIHKIGVTGGDVETRITNARLDATYLLADVEIVATYKLFNINRSRLENLLHRFFATARLDLEIMDRFGNPVRPREWFLVPLPVVNAAVEKIRDRSITDFAYDARTAAIVKR